MSAYECAEARLRAYERLLGIVERNLGPLPSLGDVDPELVLDLVEAYLVDGVPLNAQVLAIANSAERIREAAGEE